MARSFSTGWKATSVLSIVFLLALTALVLYFVIHVSVHEDDWDEDSPIDKATKVYKNETVLFKGGVLTAGDVEVAGDAGVAGDLRVQGNVIGTPEFSDSYTVCEGASVRLGDAVSWLHPEGSDGEGCVTSGFEGTPATTFTADNLVENAQVVRLVDHQHTVILGYECNYGDDDDNDNFCWKKAEYDSDTAAYKPGVQHILGGISIGVETARVFSLESAEYFGIVASNGSENDIDVYICQVENGVCSPSGAASTGFADAHYLTSAIIVGTDSSGKLILAVGMNVDTDGGVVGIYQLDLATAAAPYAATAISFTVVEPNTDGGGDDHLSVQIQRLSSASGKLRMLLGTSIQDLASDGVAIDFFVHVASVSQVDGTGFAVDTSLELVSILSGDNFEFSLTVFPGTDNWAAVYSEIDLRRVNNYISGNVATNDAITVMSHGSFAPTSYYNDDLETDPHITAITAETAVIIYRGAYRDYRLQALVFNIDASGAFVDFGDRLQVQERYPVVSSIARVSSKKFVIVTVMDSLVQDVGQFATILVGNLPSANGYDGLLHFGADNKGRSLFGIAKAAAGSGAAVDVVYAGQYCYPDTFTAEFLPMTHVRAVFGNEDGRVGTSPVVGGQFVTVFPQRIGYNRNTRCIIVDINQRL